MALKCEKNICIEVFMYSSVKWCLDCHKLQIFGFVFTGFTSVSKFLRFIRLNVVLYLNWLMNVLYQQSLVMIVDKAHSSISDITTTGTNGTDFCLLQMLPSDSVSTRWEPLIRMTIPCSTFSWWNPSLPSHQMECQLIEATMTSP